MKERLKRLSNQINKNKLNIYLFLYVFVILILSRNTMISSCIIGFEKSMLISVIFSIPLFIIFIKETIRKKLDLKKIIIILPFIIAIVVSIIVKRDWQLYNISILFYICTSIMLSSLLEFDKFKKYFINIMVFFAIFSLCATYIVKPILIQESIEEQLVNNRLIISNSAGSKFLNLGLGFAYFSKAYIRNYGIFTEPSFYQFYLIVAIVFLLFFNNDKNKIKDMIKLIILLATAFTTFSSAAILIIALIFIIQIIKLIVENRKNRKKLMIIILGIIISLVLLFQIEILRDAIKDTYNKLTTENESSISRFGSIEFTVNKFLESPLLGNRISEILPYENFLTNTTFTIAAIYGIIGVTYSLYFTYRLSRVDLKWLTISIFFVILLSYNSHVYIGVNSFWMILFSRINLKKEKINENSLDS